MRRKRKNWKFLFLSFLLFVSLYWLFIYSSPDKPLMLGNFAFPTIPLFILAVFLFISLFFTFWVKNLRRGILFGIFGAGYLILALLNLAHLFFIITLIALLIAIELFFSRR